VGDLILKGHPAGFEYGGIRVCQVIRTTSKDWYRLSELMAVNIERIIFYLLK
jgi:hypothetical protein